MPPWSWLLVSLLCVCANAKRCYWNSEDAYSYFSTVTPYDDVRGDIRDEPALDGCQPWSLWALMRHGTRRPDPITVDLMQETAAVREDIISNYQAGRGEMCAQDIQDLANWTWDSSLKDEPMYLTKEGWSELQQLGARMRTRFGALLGSLGAGAALFRATDTQRTRASAQAFLRGLDNATFTVAEPLARDEVLAPYMFCDKFAQELKEDERFEEEDRKLQETEDYQQMLSNTRRRLGIASLNPAQAAGLYELCGYERAYAPTRRHAWCAVFEQRDLRVLEYHKDLLDHYLTGYGSEYAARLGALTLKDLLASLEAAAAGARGVTGYFSHDFTLQTVFRALGLFRDYPPISGLRVEPHRRWRTSFMTPFASNLIVVMNKCDINGTARRADPGGAGDAGDAGGAGGADDAGGAGAAHELLVQVFVNERAVPLCGARACAWPALRELLLPFANATMNFCKLTSD